MEVIKIVILSVFLIIIIMYGISAVLSSSVPTLKRFITPVCFFGSVTLGSFVTKPIEEFYLKAFIVLAIFFCGGLVAMVLSWRWSEK